MNILNYWGFRSLIGLDILGITLFKGLISSFLELYWATSCDFQCHENEIYPHTSRAHLYLTFLPFPAFFLILFLQDNSAIIFGDDVYMESWVATVAYFNPYPTTAEVYTNPNNIAPMSAMQPVSDSLTRETYCIYISHMYFLSLWCKILA